MGRKTSIVIVIGNLKVVKLLGGNIERDMAMSALACYSCLMRLRRSSDDFGGGGNALLNITMHRAVQSACRTNNSPVPFSWQWCQII